MIPPYVLNTAYRACAFAGTSTAVDPLLGYSVTQAAAWWLPGGNGWARGGAGRHNEAQAGVTSARGHYYVRAGAR